MRQTQSVRPYLRRQEVCDKFRISRATLRRWLLAGDFPRPIRLGPRTDVWPDEVLEAWVERRSRSDQVAVGAVPEANDA